MENVAFRAGQERSADQEPRLNAVLADQGHPHQLKEQRVADLFKLVEVQLTGGAPWGFTLKGGREHGEPLIITKIEDGSRAAAVDKLLAGDEIVSINDIELSGSRQEAICLVKGSHKFLKLVVKRKNELACRPHSWHATKFTENQPETVTSGLSTNACASWPSQYHASSSSHDLSSSWDHSNLHRTSDQFSSAGSMDSWDHTTQMYHCGQISSAKSNSSIDHLGNSNKRDSAYGSFSTSSSTPDHTLSNVEVTSAENMAYKVAHWETPKQGNSKGASFITDTGRLEEKISYLPIHETNVSPRLEDHSDSIYSGSGRSHFVPVWYVPEKKKSPSPPPPPPLRSDSFAATKSHDRTHAPLYPETIHNSQDFEVLHKTQIRNDRSAETAEQQKRVTTRTTEKASRRRGSSPIQRLNFSPDYGSSSASDRVNNNMGNANRLYSSLSSIDVRFAQSAYGSQHHHHQRQYSDESTFFHTAKSSALSKEQQLLSSYTNTCEGSSDKHVNQTTTTTVSDMSSEENSGLNRYYCVKMRQHGKGTSRSLHFKDECRQSGIGDYTASRSSENPAVATVSQNPKYSLPQQYVESSLDKCEKRAYCIVNKGVDDMAVAKEDSRKTSCSEEPRQHKTIEENLSINHEHKYGQKHFQIYDTRVAHKDFKWNQEKNYSISPQKTPLLHSLAQEEKKQSDATAETGINKHSGFDTHLNKNARRSDRFATALKNEIQMKRAKLQKSKSTAALVDPTEIEDFAENWKPDNEDKINPSSETCSSNMYKDHLKEAQARVLKATSFQRRDLEPNSADFLPDWKTNRYNSSPLTFVSEDELGVFELPSTKQNSSGSNANHISRIGARKRFTAEQKMKSYSEPEKINEVGMSDDNCHSNCRPTTSEGALGTFADKWKFFEETSKPVGQKLSQRQALYSHPESQSSPPHRNTTEIETGESRYDKRMQPASFGVENVLCASDRFSERVDCSGYTTELKHPQRLETFAEYQASWKEQRKVTENHSSGRYHSADNILDAGHEQLEKPQYKHERSRSSPTEFYKQEASAEAKRHTEKSKEDKDLISSLAKSEERSCKLRSTDKGYPEGCLRESTAQEDSSLENKWKVSARLSHTVTSQQSRSRAGTLPSDYRYTQENVNEKSQDYSVLPLAISGLHLSEKNQFSSSQTKVEENMEGNPIPQSRKQSSVPQRPPPPTRDMKHKQQESFSALLATSSESSLTVLNRSVPSSPPVAAVNSPVSQIPSKISGKLLSTELPKSMQLAPPENVCQHLEEKTPLRSEPALPSSYRYHFKTRMEASRSPSPQLAPPKLTDKPPVAVQDKNPTRIERVMDNNTTVTMVPIKIVHSESHAEKASRQNLLTIEPPTLPSGLEKHQIKTLSTSEQSYSRFCAYTKQDVEVEPENKSSLSSEQPTEMLGTNIKENDISAHTCNARSKEKTIEDWKSEELAREIVGKDKSLADILDPNVKIKTTMDLMEGIFPKDEHLLEEAQQRRKLLLKVSSPKTEEDKKEELTLCLATPLTTNSSYYSTSAPKAELLIKMKDLQQQQQQSEEDSESEIDNNLSEKKQELIDSISRKLKVLKEARETLLEEIQANSLLGEEVEAIVKDVCKPNEFDKFRMFIGDLDKVVNLLLSLSGRLARVENALNTLDENASPEERRILVEKQKLLTQQHEDAKELKENLDRRERIVFDILASYLNDENLVDYEHFVKMKSALIIEQRELEDKIKLGEEQLKCLTDSLQHERPK